MPKHSPEILTTGPNYADKPTFSWSYPKTPSWKAYGEGRAHIELTKEDDGSLSIKASEFPSGIRGGKEVFLDLPQNRVPALIKWLKQRKH